MNVAFQSFLDQRYRYDYKNGPNIVTSEEQALQERINCIGLMHLLLKRLFNIKLPSNLRVLEIFDDNPYFKTVRSISELKLGDILFLGRKELPQYLKQYKPKYDENKKLINEMEGKEIIGDKYAGYHTVMSTGEKDTDGQPLVIDIQKDTDKVNVWSLKELMANEKYENLYKIKRVIV
jgi:hypothetical protein